MMSRPRERPPSLRTFHQPYPNTMKRRSLFTMVPAASALLALRSHGKPIAQETLTPAGFAISVQCWSLKEFTLWDAIQMSGAAGASAVEVFPGQKPAAQVRR